MGTTRALLAVGLSLVFAQVVVARNVIVEWGAHNAPVEFTIDQDIEGNDIGVTIWSNGMPAEPWKFEAYDSATNLPGYINYIKIANGVTVGGIHLSVIGDPSAGHTRGAAAVKALDLKSNSDETNVLDALDVVSDVGELGPLWADHAGTLTIGGGVLNEVKITQDVTGGLTVGGALAGSFVARNINSSISIATLSGKRDSH